VVVVDAAMIAHGNRRAQRRRRVAAW